MWGRQSSPSFPTKLLFFVFFFLINCWSSVVVSVVQSSLYFFGVYLFVFFLAYYVEIDMGGKEHLSEITLRGGVLYGFCVNQKSKEKLKAQTSHRTPANNNRGQGEGLVNHTNKKTHIAQR